jgi:hypothetical protein
MVFFEFEKWCSEYAEIWPCAFISQKDGCIHVMVAYPAIGDLDPFEAILIPRQEYWEMVQ